MNNKVEKIGFEFEFLCKNEEFIDIKKYIRSKNSKIKLGNYKFKIKKDYSVCRPYVYAPYDGRKLYEEYTGYEIISPPLSRSKGELLFIDIMQYLQQYKTNSTCGLHINFSTKRIDKLNPYIFVQKYDLDSALIKWKRNKNIFCSSYKKYINIIFNKINNSNLNLWDHYYLGIPKDILFESAKEVFFNYVMNGGSKCRKIPFLRNAIYEFDNHGSKYHSANLRSIKKRGYMEVRVFGNKNYPFLIKETLLEINKIFNAIHAATAS